MTVLRIYDPWECSEQSVPLDWECCRSCDGTGRYRDPRVWGTMPGSTACDKCVGHGSLKAAALVGITRLKRMQTPPDEYVDRCESCNHPMSEGTWEDPEVAGCVGYVRTRAEGEAAILRGDENPLATCYSVHYSPCDKACEHGGPVRWREPTRERWADGDDFTACDVANYTRYTPRVVEAAWRSVDIRTLGWPADLRPERLAVLCLRCFAEREHGTTEADR